LFVGLTTFANGPQRVDPGLASSWDVSEDGLTYVFHLRPGLKWSDGETLDADDVIFTAQVSLDPKIHSGNVDILQSGGKPWKFEKVDSLTVKVLAARAVRAGHVRHRVDVHRAAPQAREGVRAGQVRGDVGA